MSNGFEYIFGTKFTLFSSSLTFLDLSMILVSGNINSFCYLFLLFFSRISTNIKRVVPISYVIFRFNWTFFTLSIYMAPKISIILPESGEPIVAPLIWVKHLESNSAE